MFLLIAGPNSENMVLLTVHLRTEEKEDFDSFSINGKAEISIYKAFQANNLNFNEINNIDLDNKDWEDIFSEKML